MAARMDAGNVTNWVPPVVAGIGAFMATVLIGLQVLGTSRSVSYSVVSNPALRVQAIPAVGRRQAVAGFGAAAAALAVPRPANAAYGSSSGAGTVVVDPVEFKRFYGAANPPATYGGVGGTTPDLARYSYEVNVAAWKEVAVGKVDKGIGGIDSQWEGPGKKRAFAVTVTRAGEDNVGYTSGGKPEEVIKSMAGAEPNLQDALQNQMVQYEKVTVNGVDFLDFDVTGATNHYLVRVGVSKGRLFAFYVTAPEKVYAQDKDTMMRIFKSFVVYPDKSA